MIESESERMSDGDVERMAAGARAEGYDSSTEGVFNLLHQRDEARRERDGLRIELSEARARLVIMEHRVASLKGTLHYIIKAYVNKAEEELSHLVSEDWLSGDEK